MVQLRLKVFVKVSFFNVDAKRLTAGYHSRRRVHREKKKTLNPSVLNYKGDEEDEEENSPPSPHLACTNNRTDED
jgi:hypothetical protein